MAAISGKEKIRIFLAILGPDISGKILKHLPEDMAALITSAGEPLAPSREDVRLVLKDLGRIFLSGQAPGSVKKIEGEAVPGAGFEELAHTIEPEKLYGILSRERMQVIAFVLAKFPGLPVKGVLGRFSPEFRTKIEVAMEKSRFSGLAERFVLPVQEYLRKKIIEAKRGAH
jgi:flagellar motor switch protein FliG